jgi:predicted glycosyltransferase
MKILIDIGHPAHVHYFKSFINTMKGKGHDFHVVARDRDLIKSLLTNYSIQFYSRGKGNDGILGKLFYMVYADFIIFSQSRRLKPNLLISFSSPYAAQVSSFLRVPHVALNDTEHTDKVHSITTYPFSKAIITPFSYQNDLGRKHIRIKSFIEYLYLHPKRFKPDKSIYDLLKISYNEKFVLLRFVSWKAFHDVKQKGLSNDQKRKIVSYLNKKYKVFISTEYNNIEPEFEKYQISIPPERMHDVLAYSSLFVGESGTMASESALLGVPTIYINSLPLMCYLKVEQENGLLKHFKNGDGVLEYLKKYLTHTDLTRRVRNQRDNMIKDFIDPTNFLIWFVENWPSSMDIMKNNPEYQDQFKSSTPL